VRETAPFLAMMEAIGGPRELGSGITQYSIQAA